MKKNCGMSVKGTTTIKRTKQTNMKTSRRSHCEHAPKASNNKKGIGKLLDDEEEGESRCQDQNVISVSICSQIFHFPCLFSLSLGHKDACTKLFPSQKNEKIRKT